MWLKGIWVNCLCNREDHNGTSYCRILTMCWSVWSEDGLTFCAETVTSGGSSVCRAGIWKTATSRWGAHEAPALPVRRNCLRNSIVVKVFAGGFEVKCCWKIQVFCFLTPCWLINICVCQKLLDWDDRRVRALKNRWLFTLWHAETYFPVDTYCCFESVANCLNFFPFSAESAVYTPNHCHERWQGWSK